MNDTPPELERRVEQIRAAHGKEIRELVDENREILDRLAGEIEEREGDSSEGGRDRLIEVVVGVLQRKFKWPTAGSSRSALYGDAEDLVDALLESGEVVPRDRLTEAPAASGELVTVTVWCHECEDYTSLPLSLVAGPTEGTAKEAGRSVTVDLLSHFRSHHGAGS